jgi:putative membrane protein
MMKLGKFRGGACGKTVKMTDLWLAIAHHALIFGLAIMLSVQACLVREGMGRGDAARVARLDIAYGASAGLIVAVGVLRVVYGAKGHVYYVENVWFWAKIASFALMGLLSVPPTLRFRKWQAAMKNDPAFVPSTGEVKRIRPFMRWQLRLIVVIAAFAATMARYRGL